MTRCGGTVMAMWVLFLWPTWAWACAYPAPVRTVNATLLEVLNGNGQVANHQRARLQRAMSQLGSGALGDDLSRRDARAVRDVIAVASVLADGIGRTVDPDLRTAVTRVRDGIHDTCVQDDATQAGGGADATSAERGTARNEGSGGRALTFQEGVVRLSLTFTVYMTFLAFLLGLRRIVKQRGEPHGAVDTLAPADPAPLDGAHSSGASQSPAATASVMPPTR